MGLFFNYNKVGPGVRKDEPEKKSFWRFFELFGRNFWKLATANLWTVLLSIPVLTVGLAQVGLTYVTRTVSRDRHTFVTSDFFETIKKNWKQALAVGIIDMLISAILIFDLYFFYVNAKSAIGVICLGISVFITLIFIFSSYYRYMLIITFNLKLYQVYKNSFLLSICGILRNFIATLALVALYALTFALGYFTGRFGILIIVMLLLIIVPAMRSFIIQFICFPVILKYVIEPYYKEHPDDDIERRRDLGILPYAAPDDDVDWGE